MMIEPSLPPSSNESRLSLAIPNPNPKESFPSTLHRMLTEIDHPSDRDTDLREIISWQDHGMAFKIHDRKKFVDVLMPIWFSRLKYSSWVRQLNSYGFRRINKEGSDKGCLYHEEFIRDMPELAAAIQKPSKQLKDALRNKPEPDFSLIEGQRSSLVPVDSFTTLPREDQKLSSSQTSSPGLRDMLMSKTSLSNMFPSTSSDERHQGGSQFPAARLSLSSASQQRQEQEATEDDVPLKHVFERLWSTLEYPQEASTMPLDSDPLMQEPVGTWNDVEPLRIFRPGEGGDSHPGEPFGNM